MLCFVSPSEGLCAVGFTSKNPEELLRLAWCGHRSTVSVLCGIRGDARSVESCDWRHPREQRGCRRQLPRGRGRISTSRGAALLRQKQCWLPAPGWRIPATTRMLLDCNLLLQSGERNVTEVVFGGSFVYHSGSRASLLILCNNCLWIYRMQEITFVYGDSWWCHILLMESEKFCSCGFFLTFWWRVIRIFFLAVSWKTHTF